MLVPGRKTSENFDDRVAIVQGDQLHLSILYYRIAFYQHLQSVLLTVIDIFCLQRFAGYLVASDDEIAIRKVFDVALVILARTHNPQRYRPVFKKEENE